MSFTSQSPPPAEEFHIGWICAVKIEYIAALEILDEEYSPLEHKDPGDNNVYGLGRIGHHNIVIASLYKGSYGTTSATAVAKDMLRTFRCVKLGFMVGIGGGIPYTPSNIEVGEGMPPHGPCDIRLGDVVVSSPTNGTSGVVQHDTRKVLPDGKYETFGSLNSPPRALLSAVTAIDAAIDRGRSAFPSNVVKALRESQVLGDKFQRPDPGSDRLFRFDCPHSSSGPTCENCPAESEVPRSQRSHQDPKVFFGLILSGNSLIKDAVMRERLRNQNPGALCAEMEAAGLMQDFNCLVIRGISDYCDSHKNHEWQPYAALAAASFTKALLEGLPKDEVEHTELMIKVCKNILELRADVRGINTRLAEAYEQQERHHQEQLDERLTEKQQKCLEVLSGPDYKRSKDVNLEPVPGTCEWILHCSKYEKWQQSFRHDLLWVPLEQGLGKSVLSRFLINGQLTTWRPSTIVCYFFFKKNESQKRLTTALCAILHQFFIQQPHLIEQHALPLLGENGAKLENKASELWHILMTAAKDPRAHSTICVLDALNECSPDGRSQLLLDLKNFYNNNHQSSWTTTLKFFVTSRPCTEVRTVFDCLPACTRLEGNQVNELISHEIDLVVKARMEELVWSLDLPQTIAHRLEKQLFEMKNRTYLWVHLAIEHIRVCLPKSLRPEKLLVPRLPTTVKEIYEENLSRIKEGDVEDVSHILQIIVGARTPLNVLQMSIALGIAQAFEGKTQEQASELATEPSGAATEAPPRTATKAAIDPTRIESTIRNLCGFFVSIHNSTFHLTHDTVREFLLNNGPHDGSNVLFELIDAETLMARVCVRYLLMDDLISGEWDQKSINRGFVVYAAENWAHHVQRMHPSSRAETKDLIYQVYMRSHIWATIFWRTLLPWEHLPQPILAVHLVALNGHADVLRDLNINKVVMAGEADDTGTTALLWSSFNDHYEVSKLLIEQGVDVNAESARFGTPLLVAAFKGYLKLVRLFLDQGAAINHVSGDREHAHWERPYLLPHLAAHPGTALWAACLNGHLEVVQLLVDRGALDLDFALMAASRGGHLEIIQYLIAKGADINAREKEGFYGTTLQAASLGGQSKVVRFLCEKGAEDHRYYGHYENALESASRRGYGEVVRILLERREITTYEEEEIVEAFQYASNFDDSQAVNFIADYVSNVSLSTPMSTKALQIAVTEGHSSVVQSLFQKGADVKTHAQDRASNLLVSAARRGRAEVAEVLLRAGAEINAIDDDGNIAIHVAAKGGHIEVVDVLLDAGADVNALDGYQSYALHAAARGGHSEVVETLLDAEADVNALDKYQMSALHVAAGGGHSEIVEVLLEAEADVNAQDLYQRSALHFAARGNHLKVANVLLDNEADVNLRFDGHRLSGYRHCPGPDHCSGTATASETARHYKHFPIITAIGNTKRYVPRKPSAVDPHLFNGW